jgi:hypothetical protein
MRRYLVGALVAAAATTMGLPLVAGAQARQSQHANHGKPGWIVVGHRHSHVSFFVQRSHHKVGAHAASCPAGQFVASYCSTPVEQNLFGAYASNAGGVTFGSTNTTNCKALGYTSAPCGVYTTAANGLIVAFVSADGPSGAQGVTVSCKTATGGSCPVSFHQVKSENAAGGDSEVWYADATSTISKTAPVFVTATAAKQDCGSGKSACDVSLQAVTFAGAITAGATGAQGTGIGASSVCYSTKGAPSCSLTTTEPDSLVWAAVNNPTSATVPTWPSTQYAVGVADGANRKTFYSQFLGTCTANANGSKPCTSVSLPADGLYQNPFMLAPTGTPTSGTKVTINDTAPTTNAFNEVAVEIL